MARRRFQHPTVKQTATTDKSARRWYFEARVDELAETGTKRRQKTFYLGAVSAMGKREAEQRRDEILATKINRPDITLPGQVKFGYILDRFLATLNVKESTYLGYDSMVRAHLRPQWGDVAISDITPMAVEDWLLRKSKMCAEKHLKHIRSRFIEVWNRAVFWRFTREVCPTVGMQRITRYGRPTRAKTLPTLEQFHHFLYLLDEPYRSMIVVCAFTGLRIGEVMALTVAQLNSDDAEITESVMQSTGKIGPVKAKHSYRKVHMAHMRGDLAIPADAQPSDRPFKVEYFQIYHAIKDAGRRAGIDYPGFGCHTFRRMHNTMFRREAGGTDEATRLAMKQMGHGNAATNDIYYVEGSEDAQQRARVLTTIHQKVMGTIQ